MYITDQSSIISPSSEDTCLKTFESEISSVMKKKTQSTEKTKYASYLFFVELLNNDKRHFMPVVSGRHSSLFPVHCDMAQ